MWGGRAQPLPLARETPYLDSTASQVSHSHHISKHGYAYGTESTNEIISVNQICYMNTCATKAFRKCRPLPRKICSGSQRLPKFNGAFLTKDTSMITFSRRSDCFSKVWPKLWKILQNIDKSRSRSEWFPKFSPFFLFRRYISGKIFMNTQAVVFTWSC